MPDILFSVVVDRTDLGLADLDLNDHLSYYVSSQGLFGQAVSYQRNQVTSPYLDGGVTISRNKEMVTDSIGIEVLGHSNPDVQSKLQALVAAFTQDTYNLQVAFNTTVYQWACEAADYTINWDSTRWIAKQLLVNFSFPRQPVAVKGGI